MDQWWAVGDRVTIKGDSKCELNSDPTKGTPESQLPGTTTSDFMREKGLCRCNQIEDLKMRSFWISGGPHIQ